jgi:MFS family permease
MLPFLSHIGPFFRSDLNRRNYWIGVANGVLMSAADAFTEPYLVLTLFASMLTDSKFLIGLVAPVSIGGWYLPQLLFSGAVQRLPRKMPVYAAVTVIRVVGWVVVALLVWFVRAPIVLLVTFLFLLLAIRMAEGAAGVAFMDIVAKIVPPHRRGSFFGARLLLGGILALVGSAVVGLILSHPDDWVFPRQFALVFTIYIFVLAPASAVFTTVQEPDGEVTQHESGIAQQMRRARSILGQNHTLRLFLIARVLMVIGNMAMPFYIIFALERLHAPPGMVGVYLAILTLVGLLSNIWAGRISDDIGNRRLLLASCFVGLAAPALALIFDLIKVAPLLFALVFALNGIYNNASTIAHLNLLLDVSPPDDRPLYIGVSNTLVGVGILASSVGGALAQWLSMDILFGAALLAFLAAVVAIIRMQEPRQPLQEKTAG